MKIAPYPLPAYPKSDKPKADGSDGAQFPFADEGITTSIRDATLSAKPYPIKGWFVYSTNLLHALPNPQQTLKAIDELDLLVVCETIPSEIAGYADVILPDTTFLERHDDLLVGFGRVGWTSLRQPVIAPPHDQKPAWWIAKQLAEKLGIGASMPFKDMEEYLSYRIEKSGHDWAALKKEGVIMGKPQPITVESGLELTFDTPSGKVEFWSDRLAAAGFDPVPKYTKHPQAPEGYFRLVTGRAPVHTFTRTQSNPLLQDLMRENEVWVNTATAARLGLKNRDVVTLKNQDGAVSNRVRVKATQRIRDDCVYMVYGFGLGNRMLTGAYRQGASAAGLNTRYATDPLMGSTSIHGNFVTLLKEA
jgi:thiosulfate reductase / polysulfide reductase chain A